MGLCVGFVEVVDWLPLMWACVVAVVFVVADGFVCCARECAVLDVLVEVGNTGSWRMVEPGAGAADTLVELVSAGVGVASACRSESDQ